MKRIVSKCKLCGNEYPNHLNYLPCLVLQNPSQSFRNFSSSYLDCLDPHLPRGILRQLKDGLHYSRASRQQLYRWNWGGRLSAENILQEN